MECLGCGKYFPTWSGRDSSDWQDEFCSVACLEKQQRKVIASLAHGFDLKEAHLRAIITTAKRNYLTDYWPEDDPRV